MSETPNQIPNIEQNLEQEKQIEVKDKLVNLFEQNQID
jgi:hypothetical protein